MVKKFSDLKKGDKIYCLTIDRKKYKAKIVETGVCEIEKNVMHWENGKRVIVREKCIGIKSLYYLRNYNYGNPIILSDTKTSILRISMFCVLFTEFEAACKYLNKVNEKGSCPYSLYDGMTVYIYRPVDDELKPYTLSIKRYDTGKIDFDYHPYDIERLLVCRAIDEKGISHNVSFERSDSIFGFDWSFIYFGGDDYRASKMFFSKEYADKWNTKRHKRNSERTINEYVNKETNKKLSITDFMGNELHYNDEVVFINPSSSHSELVVGTIIGENKNGAIVEYTYKLNLRTATSMEVLINGDKDGQKLKRNVRSYGLVRKDCIVTKSNEVEI